MIDKLDSRFRDCPFLLITRMITDRIGLQSVILPLFIKTITKFLNVISYHQRDLSTNKTVCASRLYLDSVIGQLKGQLTGHACVSGQNASCARAVVSHFAEFTAGFLFVFFKKTYNQCPFFLKFCRSFDLLVTGLSVVQFCP